MDKGLLEVKQSTPAKYLNEPRRHRNRARSWTAPLRFDCSACPIS